MATPKVKGITIELDGVQYILPPASLATLEDLAPKLDALNAKLSGDGALALGDFGVAADLVTECLKRNYPDIDRKTVAAGIGLESISDVMAMCYDASGLLRKRLEAEAEKAAADKLDKGGTLGELTGTPSLPT